MTERAATGRSRTVVQVFARAPIPGQCKTRLHPALSHHACANLHAALVRWAVSEALASDADAVELWPASDDEHALFRELAALPFVTLMTQAGDDLGERMSFALLSARRRGLVPWLIGSDCPAQTRTRINTALATAAENPEALILRVATDGGYVGVGTAMGVGQLAETAAFVGIPWGTGVVLSATRVALASVGCSWIELAALPDIDVPADLTCLPTALQPLASPAHGMLRSMKA